MLYIYISQQKIYKIHVVCMQIQTGKKICKTPLLNAVQKYKIHQQYQQHQQQQIPWCWKTLSKMLAKLQVKISSKLLFQKYKIVICTFFPCIKKEKLLLQHSYPVRNSKFEIRNTKWEHFLALQFSTKQKQILYKIIFLYSYTLKKQDLQKISLVQGLCTIIQIQDGNHKNLFTKRIILNILKQTSIYF
eukprot:TRINITY_DN8561_c1_g1_i2.p3 TRINITY_DN8561_c1_g1~~TRINITY_DN8561_c1_g1_i2.p3  ORF type:complete len:189 (+),score=-11.89 TRINITY_DN8561_c1_g1_i2:1949-2515(+)